MVCEEIIKEYNWFSLAVIGWSINCAYNARSKRCGSILVLAAVNFKIIGISISAAHHPDLVTKHHRLTSNELLGSMEPLYRTIDSLMRRNAWNIANCWHCCFSFFNNGSILATFEGSNWSLSAMCKYFLINLNLSLLMTFENIGAS